MEALGRICRQWFTVFSAAVLITAFCGCQDSSSNQGAGSEGGKNTTGELGSASAGFVDCSFTAAQRSGDGIARLALLVGVGEYQHDSIHDLPGPPEDIRQMHALLTGAGGYGFPQQNVCRLVNDSATGDRVRQAVQKALVERARQGDIVVVYFSGHGTQLPDGNRDEPDLFDEALMLADSRVSPGGVLRDDELAALLQPLRSASGNVVVVLDSCTSGSATRAGTGALIERYQAPRAQDLAASVRQPEPVTGGDESATWFEESVPGLVAIGSAVDGTVAIETGGRGVFTDALVSVLSQVQRESLTYRQLARKVPPLVASRSSQVSMFTGDLDRVVFGAVTRTRPAALEVTGVGPSIKLGGTLMPGLGPNSELRVFDSSAMGVDFNDPAKSKALLVVDRSTGLNAEAHVDNRPANARAIEPGDLAVLVRPSDASLAFRVRLRPAAEPGGIPTARAASLAEAFRNHPEASQLVGLSSELEDFELALDAEKRINILGPEGRVRSVLESDRSAVENLWLHARQRAFLNLRGEGGSELTDDESLRVEVIGVDQVPGSRQRQSPCMRRGGQLLRDARGSYVMPLCYSWRIKVSLSKQVRGDLQVGGVILSSDGSILGFPKGNQVAVLSPNQRELIFSTPYVAGPPVGIDDYLLVFGTRLDNPVDWRLLTQTAAERSTELAPRGSLHRALDRYFKGLGSRAQSEAVERSFEDSSWTRTTVALRVEPNPVFEPGTGPANPGSREYTIKDFEIRPYLPDDPAAPLYRLLTQAHGLTAQDFPYKQHDWSRPSDAANLALGIDCSRAIWYAFTRAGLQYNSAARYLTTAQMANSESTMSEMFAACPAGENLETGDVLVYRDDRQGDGHVVMVIDPAKRIAWGSHGWDGNAKAFKVEPDTGVEYQLIKHKKDWRRWDRANMQLKACWRYKPFIGARKTGSSIPGRIALGKSCEERVCSAK